MRTLRAFWIRLTSTLRRQHAEEDLAAELEAHIALHEEDAVRAGLSPHEARRQALIQLGGLEQTRQRYRERAGLPWLESVFHDVRYALRGFRRNPLFTLTVIATLALGIGATTAVFSVVDRILFRSLPYAHDDRLVSFGLSQSLERQEFTLGGFFYEWRDNQKPFQSVTFERGVGECNLNEQNPVQLLCGRVAANFLSTLGVTPALGRNFLPEEDVPNGAHVALISDSLWLSRFNRDPGVLNRTLNIDGHTTRIVGVLPRDFEMPRLQKADMLIPAQMDVAAQHTVNAGIGFPMWAFARLKPGVSLAEARAEMDPLFRHTQQWIPPQIRNDFHLAVRSVRDRQMQEAYSAAWILLGAVIAVLLIACANVASLFSARGVARARELAVRSALGATRARLVRQTLTDATLLAVAGGVAGCLLAAVLLRIFIAIAPTSVPLIASARLDLRIVAFTGILALGCAIVFGILPALQQPGAKGLIARAGAHRFHARGRQALVALQIGISVVLLAGAVLLAESFRNLERQNLGIDTHGALVVRTPLTPARYPNGQAYMDFYLRAEAALRRLPGVTAVGLSDSMPLDGWHDAMRYADIVVRGQAPNPAGIGGSVVVRSVTPDYFKALDIPFAAGNDFTETDRNENGRFMILSHELARRLFPGGDAVGKHLQLATFEPYLSLKGPIYTVAGVAGDVKNGTLAGQDDPELYILRRNRPEDWSAHAVILLSTELPPTAIEPWVKQQIAQLDLTVPVEMERLSQTVSRLADRPRFEAALFTFFAMTGLVLAVVGLYGVIAYRTAQRTPEIGLRMALGADKSDILQMILVEGAYLTSLGGILGLIAALALVRLLKSLLFGISPYDPISFAFVVLLLAIVATASCALPAWRASKVEPSEALRTE